MATTVDWPVVDTWVGNMYKDDLPKYTYTISGTEASPVFKWQDPQPVPDALCGNCRRDRHDYPLSETVAEMWKSLSFDEDYDPASDVSRIVCPGSDVCGPVVATGSTYTNSVSSISWTLNTGDWVIPAGSMEKYWSGFNADVTKLGQWPNPYLPEITAETVHEWEYKADHGWTISELNELKGKWTLPNYTFPEAFAFAPVDQAAIEAAPKQIEHEAPQPAGFDFSNIKTQYSSYPTGKKKKK